MRSTLLIIGIVAISLNLRPAITAVGPLIGNIQADLHLSAGMVALTTALPLLSFALFSAVVPGITRRFGNEMTLAAGVAILLAGIGVRFIPSVTTLFIGTFVAGVGIAMANVTLPGLIKDRFSDRVGVMTGLYSASMTFFAATASGLSVPMAADLGWGWRGALGFWALPAAVALLLWWPQVRAVRPRERRVQATSGPNAAVWRSPLAWQVSLFMGLQSVLFYVLVTWLPELLQSKGMSEASAGWMLSIAQYVSLPTTLFMPMLADRIGDQRPIVVAALTLYAAALAGFFSNSSGWLIFGIIGFGLAMGTSIGLSLTFIGLRAANPQDAAQLSGMAQSVGYLLAAIGPVSLGVVYDLTNSWNVPLISLIAVCFLTLLAGLGAGRNVTLAG